MTITSTSRAYLPPIRTQDGVQLPAETDVGKFTLAANTTYVFILNNTNSPFQSVQLSGYDAGLVITSATIQDTDHGALEVSDTSTAANEWVPETPSTAYVSVVGSGWTVGTTGIVASNGSAIGTALWHVSQTGSARTRLIVVVGSTGGKARVSANGRD